MKIPTKAELKKANVAVLERMSMAGWTKRIATSVGVDAEDTAEAEWKKDGLTTLKMLRRFLVTSKGDPIPIAEFVALLGIVSSTSLQYLDEPDALLGNPIRTI